MLDNLAPHLSTKIERSVGEWPAANKVDSPTQRPTRLNRIEAQSEALRYFALEGTAHGSHREQASMIRRYIWRNRNTHDKAIRELVNRANVARRGTL